jgi:quercetin dioxygenase-like cupin family protein
MKKLLAATSGLALAFCALAGSTADATPGGGTTVSNELIGVLDGPTKAQQDGVRLRTREDSTVRVFTLTYAVGAYSGWHSHPGIVVATVRSGSVIQQVGCERHTWTAGQSFTEVEPHYVRNLYRKGDEGAVPAVLEITQIFPAGAATREDAPPPKCGS